MKVLPAHFADDERFEQRFRREAHAAARLNNPHVVPDSRLRRDRRPAVCGYAADRGPRPAAVLAEGPLRPARAVRIIEDVALALHAAHEVGLVHRDVKPSNILLDDDDFAYLIDFGIARAAGDTRLTSSGAAIGTWHYMAPERFEQPTEADARADIYALACVLYECLTGQPAVCRGHDLELQVAAHLKTPPPRPSTTQPDSAHANSIR